MLKSLIKIRLQGIFMRTMRGSKKQKITAGKIFFMLAIFYNSAGDIWSQG